MFSYFQAPVVRAQGSCISLVNILASSEEYDIHVKVMSSCSQSIILEFWQKKFDVRVYDYMSQLIILVYVRGVTQVKITNLVYIPTLIM